MSRQIIVSLDKRRQDLYNLRHEKFMKGEEIDFSADGGPDLYEDTLSLICEKLAVIKKKFPQKVDRCDLFNEAENPIWQKDFKDNFYKIFIDRLRNLATGPNPQLQFNNNTSEFDLCYCESFARSFLQVLLEVEKRFTEETEMTYEEFFDFMSLINETITRKKISDENAQEDHNFSSYIDYEYAKIKQAYQAQVAPGSSHAYYNFMNNELMNDLGYNYPHKLMLELCYLDCIEKIKVEPDPRQAINEMAMQLPTYAHCFEDANGRTSSLMGWLVAILNNVNFAVLTDPYNMDLNFYEDDAKWTKDFLASPSKIPPMTVEQRNKYNDSFNQMLCENDVNHLVGRFFSSVIYAKNADNKRIYVELPFDPQQPLFIGLGDNDQCFVVTQKHFSGAQEIDLSDLTRVVSSCSEELFREPDFRKRSDIIAFNFLEFVSQNWLDEDFEVAGGKNNFLEYILDGYQLHSSDAEKVAEYQELRLELKKKLALWPDEVERPTSLHSPDARSLEPKPTTRTTLVV